MPLLLCKHNLMYCQNSCKIEHTCQQPNLFVHVYDILPLYVVNVSICLHASRGKIELQLPFSIDLQDTFAVIDFNIYTFWIHEVRCHIPCFKHP
jgi:hypothetical protein